MSYAVEIVMYPRDGGKFDPNELDRMADEAGMTCRSRIYVRKPTYAEWRRGITRVAGIRGTHI